ncbi:MAG: hypothetical protein HC812_00625 [Leptolyngbya sp. RL_3_1]|nr:hypothetical protein [Leptolyngbya sp. RL_3_1]
MGASEVLPPRSLLGDQSRASTASPDPGPKVNSPAAQNGSTASQSQPPVAGPETNGAKPPQTQIRSREQVPFTVENRLLD